MARGKFRHSGEPQSEDYEEPSFRDDLWLRTPDFRALDQIRDDFSPPTEQIRRPPTNRREIRTADAGLTRNDGSPMPRENALTAYAGDPFAYSEPPPEGYGGYEYRSERQTPYETFVEPISSRKMMERGKWEWTKDYPAAAEALRKTLELGPLAIRPGATVGASVKRAATTRDPGVDPKVRKSESGTWMEEGMVPAEDPQYTGRGGTYDEMPPGLRRPANDPSDPAAYADATVDQPAPIRTPRTRPSKKAENALTDDPVAAQDATADMMSTRRQATPEEIVAGEEPPSPEGHRPSFMRRQYEQAKEAGDLKTQYDILSDRIAKGRDMEPEVRSAIEAERMRLARELGLVR